MGPHHRSLGSRLRLLLLALAASSLGCATYYEPGWYGHRHHGSYYGHGGRSYGPTYYRPYRVFVPSYGSHHHHDRDRDRDRDRHHWRRDRDHDRDRDRDHRHDRDRDRDRHGDARPPRDGRPHSHVGPPISSERRAPERQRRDERAIAPPPKRETTRDHARQRRVAEQRAEADARLERREPRSDRGWRDREGARFRRD